MPVFWVVALCSLKKLANIPVKLTACIIKVTRLHGATPQKTAFFRWRDDNEWWWGFGRSCDLNHSTVLCFSDDVWEPGRYVPTQTEVRESLPRPICTYLVVTVFRVIMYHAHDTNSIDRIYGRTMFGNLRKDSSVWQYLYKSQKSLWISEKIHRKHTTTVHNVHSGPLPVICVTVRWRIDQCQQGNPRIPADKILFDRNISHGKEWCNNSLRPSWREFILMDSGSL
jgi:hypothetical protein